MPETTADLDDVAASNDRGRDRRAARRRRRRRTSLLVAAVVAASAVAGALASGSPTGLDVVDLVYRAAFAAVVPLAASKARRWTWFVLAGVAGAASTDDWVPFILAGAALAVTFASVLTSRRQRLAGAIVGALAVQALLRLPTELPFGVPTLVAALAPVPVYLSALRNVRRPRRYWAALGAVGGVLVVIGASFGVAMLSVDDRAGTGVRAARTGIEAARAGQDELAESAFAQAEADLADAATTASAWWVTPARAVPVLAQHVRAVAQVAEEGRALAALSADQVATLDVTGLSMPGGGIDLDRIVELQPGARSVAEALERAQRVVGDASSRWLLPQATDRLDEFAAEVRGAAPTARNAADALEVAPDLLGADGAQRYLVLVGNPAEARELGGFVGAVGTLTAEEGRLRFDSAGELADVNLAVAASGASVDPATLPPPLAGSRPNRFVQNWSNTVDLERISRVATELGPAIVEGSVDGVLYLDPHAVAALLEITGPVAVEGRAEPLSAVDAVDFLQREQYRDLAQTADGERKERLRDAADAAFQDLTSGTLPDPRALVDVLAGPVRAGRLLFTATADEPRPLLERLGLARELDSGTTDQILVAHDNQRANKLDAYLQRHVTYQVDIDRRGSVEATLIVELVNDVPDGLDPYVTGGSGTGSEDLVLPEGLNRLVLAAYSRFEPTSVSVEGDEVPAATSVVAGLSRTAVPVDVPQGSTVTVEYRFVGAVESLDYSLALMPNASANGDTVEARIEVAGTEQRVQRRPWDRTLLVAPHAG